MDAYGDIFIDGASTPPLPRRGMFLCYDPLKLCLVNRLWFGILPFWGKRRHC